MADLEAIQYVCVCSAIRSYAAAAVCAEKMDHQIGAEQMWFVVRALCHEHGVPYDEVTARARSSHAGWVGS